MDGYVMFDRGANGMKLLDCDALRLADLCKEADLCPCWENVWNGTAVECSAEDCIDTAEAIERMIPQLGADLVESARPWKPLEYWAGRIHRLETLARFFRTGPAIVWHGNYGAPAVPL